MSQAADETAYPIALQVAQHIVTAVNGITVTSDYLAQVIQEPVVQTTITGSSLLHLHVIDPYWVVLRSGLCDFDASGELLHDVDVNFPEGSDMWWRLRMVDFSNDLTDANVTLTFMDRAICLLENDWGPVAVAPGTRTRAQFVKQLIDRCNRLLNAGIKAVIPEVNEIQPVASSTTSSLGTTLVKDATSVANAHAKINKTSGVGNGAGITIKGQAPSATQVALINQVMGLANALNAGPLATQALLEACIAENDFTNNPGGGGGSSGLLQLIPSTAAQAGVSQLDVNGCVTAFLTNGYNPHGGTGAIAYAAAHPNAPAYQVAQFIQGSGAGLASNGASNYGPWLAEANAIISAGGGISSGSLGTSSSAGGTSDVSQLTRGTSSNPDEDSWTCIQRLAGDVNWNAFSNAEYVYYIDGPTMAAQKPTLYLRLSDDGTYWTAIDPATGKTKTETSVAQIITNLSGTFDDTQFKFLTTHTRKGRVQRKTAIRKPQTAGRLQMNMVCGVFEFRAGEVIVFQNAGPANGRWIIEDTTRNVFVDVFTQFTLGPPVAPLAEPQAQASSSTTPAPAASPLSPASQAALAAAQGTIAGVAQAAQLALARQQAGHMFHYQQLRPIDYAILTSSSMHIDCSGFALACAKAAGLPDPSGNNYDGAGYTGDIITHCTQVAQGGAVPGMFCFYGPSTSATEHMTVYVGNGQVISMGSEGDPSIGPAAQMGPAGFLGYWLPNSWPTAVTGAPAKLALGALTAAGAVGTTGLAGAAPVVAGVDKWLFGGH